MRKSPIRLKSSSKMRATKSPSRINLQSDKLYETKGNQIQSVHMIPLKESPKMAKRLESSFTEQDVRLAQSRSYNNLLMRSGSPVKSTFRTNKIDQSQHDRSLHVTIANSPTKVRFYMSPQKENSPQVFEKIRLGKSNEKSLIKIENDRKSPVITVQEQVLNPDYIRDQIVNKVIRPVPQNQVVHRTIVQRKVVNQPFLQQTPKVQQIVHSTSIVQQRPVSQHPHLISQKTVQQSAKQVQLQRKVRILQSRLNEVHTQKSQIESNLNELNIRLQYQNNFLKEKLNSIQRVESCTNCSTKLGVRQSQKLIKDLEKSEENQYHQSKQIHALKSHLQDVEEMLSQQINKSLQLLGELQDKENQNQAVKLQFSQLERKLQQLEASLQDQQRNKTPNKQSELNEFKLTIQNLESNKINLQNDIEVIREQLITTKLQNHQLKQQIQTLQKQSQDLNISRELMGQLETNNLLLIQAIKDLQSKLHQAEDVVQRLNNESQSLLDRILNLQSQNTEVYEHLHCKQTDFAQEMTNLSSKLTQVEKKLHAKDSQLSTIHFTLTQCEKLVHNKDEVIKSQSEKIEFYLKLQQQSLSKSTTSSFYQKSSVGSCTKCDELRKTVFKLNSQLTKSGSKKEVV